MGFEHVIGHAGERHADEVSEEVDHPQCLRGHDSDRAHRDKKRALEPDARQREDQRDIAKIEEIGRPVIMQIDRKKHRHERGVGELEPKWNAWLENIERYVSHASSARAESLRTSTLPDRMRTTRSHRRASSASWVTSTRVVPRST